MEAGGRAESVITFTLVSFLYNTFIKIVDVSELVLLGLFVIALSFTLKMFNLYSTRSDALSFMNQLHKLLILLWSQAILNLTTQQITFNEQHLSTWRVLNMLVDSIIILLFASSLASILQMPEYTDRTLTLLLYMFTDASQNILLGVRLNWQVFFILILVYAVVHLTQDMIKLGKQIEYLARAINMLSINIVLSVLFDQYNIQNIWFHTVFLILFLLFLDTVSQIVPMFQATSDYALWRTAQALTTMYRQTRTPLLIAICVTVQYFLVRYALSTRMSSPSQTHSVLFSLLTLFLVNVLLAGISEYISGASAHDQLCVLGAYVILVHSAVVLLTSVLSGGDAK